MSPSNNFQEMCCDVVYKRRSNFPPYRPFQFLLASLNKFFKDEKKYVENK